MCVGRARIGAPIASGREDVNSDSNGLSVLVSACVALGIDLSYLTDQEQALVANAAPVQVDTDKLLREIRAGGDPLGEMFCTLRSSVERRAVGQTFTPPEIVESMLSWAAGRVSPARVVDPGTGSGRFIVRALERFPNAKGIAIDTDPAALLMARANAHVWGVDDRIVFHLADYREVAIEKIDGITLYVGNPPYVRHHDIQSHWKDWYAATAKEMRIPSSKLAGLHSHFFLATAKHMQPGDVGVYITSSEWLDVNYGASLRRLLLSRLSLEGLHVFDPASLPFADAQVTGVITCFNFGVAPDTVLIDRVCTSAGLGSLMQGVNINRAVLESAPRWSSIGRSKKKYPQGYMELGEYFRVHRGTVTGANKVWVVQRGSVELPDSVLYPSVTKARELFASGTHLTSDAHLKCVVDIPLNYQALDEESVYRIERYIAHARSVGADQGYIARHRKAWWSVGLGADAPILATYMARRPPRFVRNVVHVRHINVVHGLYPRESYSDHDLDLLLQFLNGNVELSDGRTYAGGLTKFEPKEMERLMVPSFDILEEGEWNGATDQAIGLVQRSA